MDEPQALAAEFTRQAPAMDAAGAFRVEAGLEGIVRAVGEVRPARVLDLACGPGLVAEVVAPLAGTVVGVDATPRMVQLATARCATAGHSHVTFQVARAEQLPFDEGSFDVVIARLAVHHFPRPAEVLAEVWRVLRAGGRLVIADIVTSEHEAEAALHNALEQLRDPTHVRMRTESELTALVEAAGFAIASRESWTQARGFEEWAGIANDAGRTAPLRVVMRALARAGLHAGIGLADVDGDLRFTHAWRLLVAHSVAHLDTPRRVP